MAQLIDTDLILALRQEDIFAQREVIVGGTPLSSLSQPTASDEKTRGTQLAITLGLRTQDPLKWVCPDSVDTCTMPSGQGFPGLQISQS